MPTPYRIELFERDFTFRSFAPISAQPIEVDYLANTKNAVSVPRIKAEKGDYAVIYKDNRQLYVGIVDEITTEKKEAKLTLKPLQAIFDVNVYAGSASYATIEEHIAALIRENFAASSDAMQNILGIEIETTSATFATLGVEDPLVNLYELMRTAMTAFGVVVDMDVDVQQKRITAKIGTVDAQTVIEADLPAILNKEVVLGDSYGQLNKVIIYDEEGEGRKAEYYLHPDGSVDKNNADRIYPVFFTTLLVKGEDDADFAALAEEQAIKALSPQQYDNMIELTAQNDSRVFPVNLPIGARAEILVDGKVCRSMLTGYIKAETTTTLIFGIVRVELTKKLLMQTMQQAGARGSSGGSGGSSGGGGGASIKLPLSIANGGTGVTTLGEMIQTVFTNGNAAVAKEYPTSGGYYCTTGTDIFSNLTQTHSNYGVLVIFRAFIYQMHIYVDLDQKMFYGWSSNSGGTITEPSAWQQIDGIVEQGTSGIWTYRKYQSGIAECWGTQDYSGSSDTAWGSLYRMTCTAPTYPIAFKEVPAANLDIVSTSGSSYWISSWSGGNTSSLGTFALVRPVAGGTVGVKVSFYARGKWK